MFSRISTACFLEISAFSAIAAASWDFESAFAIIGVLDGCCCCFTVLVKKSFDLVELNEFTRFVQAKNHKNQGFLFTA
jgi:hypothetical protein